jgi:alcohol dehydrogenase class IV
MSTPVFGLLRTPGEVLFGAGQRFALGPATAAMGRSAMVCTDARMAGTPEFAELIAGLADAGVRVRVFAEVAAELPAGSVEECVRQIGADRPDVLVGIGGGSCLDHAKLTALLLTHGGRLADYYGEFRVPGPCLPVIAVPTTAGTGSEVTPVAVLADPGRELKVGISSPYLIPRVAIVDPELSYGCPPALTAHAAADALSHCVEAFTAIRRPPLPRLAAERVFVGKSLFTDRYALAGIALIGRGVPAVLADPADPDGRQDLMLAALYGGFALGTAGTAAAHALQYPVGAATQTPHGLGVGALLPYVMRFNRSVRVPEFAQIAGALGVAADGTDDEQRATAAILAIDGLLNDLGIPGDVKQMGLAEDRLGWAAEQGMTAARLIQNNPRDLDVAALREILAAAFEGRRS